jgi:WD40 repeat protein
MINSDDENMCTDNLLPSVPEIIDPEIVPAHLISGEAINSSPLYGREQEILTLERWILAEQARLVAVVGMGGMGKTALIGMLTQRIQTHFDFVIWRSLRNGPYLEDVVLDCLSVFARLDIPLHNGLERKLSLLMSYLRSHRCLLVFDNVETILQEGEGGRVGHYLAGYEDYDRFLLQIAELHHQSCMLLTSREKPKSLSLFEGGKRASVRLFRLAGLNDGESQQFLQEQGLIGDAYSYSLLNSYYAGNPLALRMVAGVIHDLFVSDVTAFLHRGEHVFSDIRDLLDEQFERLSQKEKRLLYWLAIERDLISLDKLIANIVVTAPGDNVLEGLDFLLRRRSWIERGEMGQAFTLQPVIMEYVTVRLIEQVYNEIQAGSFQLLRHHALLKAQAKDYIRNTQKRLILKPLLEKLLSLGRKEAENVLTHALVTLQQEIRQQGYAAGNILNLLASLTRDLRGYDFSHLTIWQAYFQEVDLRDANFSSSDVATSVFIGAFSSILSLAFSADETLLAVGTTRGDIWVWDITAGKLLFSCEGHNAWVMSIAFNVDGTILASGGGDHHVKLWDLKHGQHLKSFEGHTREVSSVTFSPNGKTLASGSYDQCIMLWDLQYERTSRVFQACSGQINALAFSSNGKSLASGSHDGSVDIWDVETERLLISLQGHSNPINSLTFSHNATMVISADAQSVRTWNIATGDCLDIFESGAAVVSAVHVTDSVTLAICKDARTIKLYDAHKHICLSVLTEQDSIVDRLVCGPSGKSLVITDEDQRLRIWDVQSGQCLRTLQGYTNSLWSLIFNTDGTRFASGGDDRCVRIWDTSNGQCLKSFQGHSNAITAMAFSHNSNLLASGSWDQSVKLWDVQSGRCIKTFQKHQSAVWSIAFSPDDTKLLCGCHDQSATIWDVQTGQCLHTLPAQNTWADAISVIASPQAMLLATSSKDCTIQIWDVSRGLHLYTLQGHNSPIWSLAFSPDASLLASGSGDQHIKIWSMTAGECLRSLQGHTGWISTLAFRLDGKILASGGSDQHVNLWNVHTGQLLTTQEAHTSRVTAVALSPSGNMLVSTDFDEHIVVWNVKAKTVLRTLRIDRPYERMNITDITGLTDAQKLSLKILGAFETVQIETIVPIQPGTQDNIHLTKREQDILRLIVDGYSNHEVAQALYISKATVKTHINNLFTKLGVQDRSQAAFVARQLNLLS